MYLNTDFVCYS